TEQQLVVMQKDYSDEHPEVVRLTALMKTLNDQIESRINGILDGLKAVVAARKAIVDEITKKLSDAKETDAVSMEKYRPYFKAKRDLETQQKLRDSIFIRILQETVDKAIPKGGMVEVVDPATPSN